MTLPDATTKDGYPLELAVQARRMSLYVATVLGDLLDQIVIVGGLIPYLIVDQAEAGRELHVGTRDLDLGLALAVLKQSRYHEIATRLREAGFSPATKGDTGNRIRQTWAFSGANITIDFLIGAARGLRGGTLQDLETDLAAVVTPALPLAFLDSLEVEIDDVTILGERAKRTVRECGPAAFVALKAHAILGRKKDKDAYDLVYLLANYGDGSGRDVIDRYRLIERHAEAQEALRILADEFETIEHVGPRRRAAFLGDAGHAGYRQDAVGVVAQFLRGVRRGK